MRARVLPVMLVLGALAADRLGNGDAAFTLLVASVPAAAVSALALFGRLVELPGGAIGLGGIRLEAVLGALGLVCVVVAAAARGQATDAATLPALAASAAVAALALYSMQTLAALVRPR